MKKIFVVFLLVVLVVNLTVSKLFAYTAIDLGNIVVTATRIAQHGYKIAGNVTVIGKEEIEASNAENVQELLNSSLGVYVYDYGTAKSASVDIRGFGETANSNVLVLINDRKINSVDLSGPDLSRIPLGSVERIEIIRGAGSVLYGDNAVGGVVNIITKKGTGDLTGRLGSTYDSYSSRGTDLEFSGEKNHVSYYVYSKYLDQHGYRENSDVLINDINARLGYDFHEKIKADLNVLWHNDKFGLPGALSDTNLATLGRQGSAAQNDYAETTDRSVNLTLDVNPWPEDMYFGKLVLDLLYRNRDVLDVFESFSSDAKRNTDTTGVSGKYIFDRTVFGKEVNFVTGVDFYDNKNNIAGGQTNTSDIIITKNELGVYGFLEYELFNQMFVNAGTRYHQAEYVFDDRALGTYNSTDPSEWVSMGGVKYEYAPGSNLHASVQQTFRFPATDELYSSFTGMLNTDLIPQTGIQYEVGIKHNLNDTVVAHVTPYCMVLDDEIFFDPRNFQNSNIDSTRRIGVEVGQETDLLKFFDIGFLDNLNFFTNYNYQDPTITNGPNKDKDIPFVAHHQASVGLATTFLDHYNISFIGRYVGSRFAISDFSNISTPIKPYYVLDSKVSYTMENLEIYAAVNNITNALYTGTIVFVEGFGNFHYPSPERNYSFGVNVKF